MIGLMFGLTLANSLMLGAVLYLLISDRPPGPGRAEVLARTEQGYLASVRESLTDAMGRGRPRRTIVIDDWHQARAEKQAHRDGATLRPPPRFR